MADFKPCAQLDFHCADSLLPLIYMPQFDEYVIERRDSPSAQCLVYCPFCGGKLPPSRRDNFFDALEKMGVEYRFGDDDVLPTDFETDAWWRRRGT